VNRQLVGEQMSAARRLDRVDVADQVGDRDIGRGELLDESVVPPDPRDRRVVACLVDDLASVLRDRCERVVIDLTAGDDRHRFVEQRRQRAQDARLRLAAQPEQDEVVPREDRVHDLRHYRILVSQHARE
jgi:hypothetical protein